jgi:hypothetical protein
MRIARIVCGSRTYKDRVAVNRRIEQLVDSTPYHPSTVVVIHGAAAGADSLASDAATDYGASVVAMPYISALGKRGGPERNRTMLVVLMALQRVGYDVGVIAFLDKPLSESHGTRNMVEQARSAGVATEVVGL